MRPRLSSSIRWTPFPSELTTHIHDVFKNYFEELNLDGEVRVEGRIYPAEIMLRVGTHCPDRLAQHNFEGELEYDPSQDNALKMIHLLVDAIGVLVEQFADLDDPDDAHQLLPACWSPVKVKAVTNELADSHTTVYVQYCSANTQLEHEANVLLGLADIKLVNEEVPINDSFGIDDSNKASIKNKES